MSEEPAHDAPRTGASSAASRSGSLRSIPRWKQVLLTVAGFVTLAGLGLQGYGFMRGEKESESAQQRNVASSQKDGDDKSDLLGAETAFLPWDGGEQRLPPGDTEASVEERRGPQDWSPVLVRSGFSFLVAFCLGYVFRVFAKLSTAVLGLYLAGLFWMSYVGFVEVHWDAIQSWFDTAVAGLKEQSEGLQHFVAGSLPTAGSAALGFFTGYKKS